MLSKNEMLLKNLTQTKSFSMIKVKKKHKLVL